MRACPCLRCRLDRQWNHGPEDRAMLALYEASDEAGKRAMDPAYDRRTCGPTPTGERSREVDVVVDRRRR